MNRILLPAILAVFGGTLCAQSFTVSTTPVSGLPGVDGKVWDIKEHNNKLYIAGEFTQVGGVARSRLAEIDLSTNQVTNWNPAPDDTCTSLTIYSGRLYVGGAFTQVAGQARESLASFDLSTHTLTSWNPTCSLPAGASNAYFDDDVHVMKLVNSTLYIGGGFSAIDNTPRGAVASFDLTSLSTANGLTAWDPNVQIPITSTYGLGGVQGMYIDPTSDRCVITGPIIGVGGDHWHDGSASGHTLLKNEVVCVDASGSGAPVTNWLPVIDTFNNAQIVNTCCGIGSTCYISGMIGQVTTGGVAEQRFTTAGIDMTADTTTTNAVNAFDIKSSKVTWAWGTDVGKTRLFMGGDFTSLYGGLAVNRLCMVDPATGAIDAYWRPDMDARVDVIEVTQDRVYVGGEFTSVNGSSSLRLTAFDITYATNLEPSVSVDVNGTSINLTSGTTGSVTQISVPQYQAVSGLNVSINVDDPNGDPVEIAASWQNLGTTGIQAGEWASASAATPYALTPSSGSFNTPSSGADPNVWFVAKDPSGATVSGRIVFKVVAAPNSAPLIQVSSGGQPVASGSSLQVQWDSTLGALQLAFLVYDSNGDNVSLSGNVSPIGTTGILNQEFSSIAQMAGYTVTPTTGRFSDAQTTHTVTLVADDGKGGTTTFSFNIVVGTAGTGGGGGNASGGSGSGGGGCTTGGEAGIWLLAGLLGFLGLAWLRRRTA